MELEMFTIGPHMLHSVKWSLELIENHNPFMERFFCQVSNKAKKG